MALGIGIFISLMTAEGFPPDFDIISGGNVVRVSFHAMAIKCSRFNVQSKDIFPGNRYETYLPVTEDALRVFAECVYDLVRGQGPSAASRITSENIHSVALLAEEFRCQALLDITTDILNSGDKKTAGNIQGLIIAIQNGNGELCAHFEGLLASDINEALIRLKDVPTAQVPIGHILLILTKHVSENHGIMNDKLLCDLILAKLDIEEEDDACTLVDFLDLNKLEWRQLEALFQNERIQRWPCFSGRVGASLIRACNSRVEICTTGMRQMSAQLWSRIEEMGREVGELLKSMKLGKMSDVERKFQDMFGSLPPENEDISLETREKLADMTSMLEEMNNDLMEQMESRKDEMSDEEHDGQCGQEASESARSQNDGVRDEIGQSRDHPRSTPDKLKSAAKIGASLLLARPVIPY